MEDPQVIQNSDFMYKSNVEWIKDVPYQEPNEYERDMLKGTLSPNELLKKELEEQKIERTPEQKRRDAINIVKVVSLHRIGLQHFIFNPYKLSTQQKKKYKKSMELVLAEYNDGPESRDSIIKEFNNIVCDTILDTNVDVSTYPVYDDTPKTNTDVLT